MIGHKFLARGATGRTSRFAWPTPLAGSAGEWVEVVGALAPCARGIHVCRPGDLAYWLDEELWEIEAGGDLVEGIDCVVARRGRLLGRVGAWQEGGAARFAEACVARAAELAGKASGDPASALVDDARGAVQAGHVAAGAYCAALAVARRSGPEGVEAAFRAERAWQASWLARELLGPRGAVDRA